MPNQDIQNYLEDFYPEDLEKVSPFIQGAFSRIKYAFNSRLNFKDCSFTVDFSKEELTRFVSLALKEEEKVWKYKNNSIYYLNNLSLSREEFNYRLKRSFADIEQRVPNFVLWYYRYLKKQYNVNVQYTVYITGSM